MTEMHAVLLIAVTALVTIVIRAIPFVLFGGDKELPASVRYLGQVLPPAIMAALVIYCLKGVDLTVMPRGLAELLAVAVVAVLHLWKRNNGRSSPPTCRTPGRFGIWSHFDSLSLGLPKHYFQLALKVP